MGEGAKRVTGGAGEDARRPQRDPDGAFAYCDSLPRYRRSVSARRARAAAARTDCWPPAPTCRPTRLLDAYAQGIFPWFGGEDPLLWWSPDPRMVLYVRELHVSRSLRRTIRSGRFRVTIDTAFPAVIERLRRAAPGQDGHVDHAGDGRRLLPALRDGPRPFGRSLGRRPAGGRPLRRRASGACSSASRCSAGRATRRRWRSCTWWRSSDAGGCRSSTARCRRRTWPRSAPARFRAPTSSTRCSQLVQAAGAARAVAAGRRICVDALSTIERYESVRARPREST